MNLKGPDDLEKGKTYRFEYISAVGLSCLVLGKFEGITIEHKIMWFWFNSNGTSSPYEYQCLQNLSEVQYD